MSPFSTAAPQDRPVMPSDAVCHTGLVQAQLVTDSYRFAPGKPFRLGVLLVPREGWHLYWKHPGDDGVAVDVSFELPAGFQAGPLLWPAPERMTLAGGAVVYGYHGTMIWTEVTPPDDAEVGTVFPLRASVSWVAVKDQGGAGSLGACELAVVRECDSGSFEDPVAYLFTRFGATLPRSGEDLPAARAELSLERPDGFPTVGQDFALHVVLRPKDGWVLEWPDDGYAWMPHMAAGWTYLGSDLTPAGGGDPNGESGLLAVIRLRLEDPLPARLDGLLRYRYRAAPARAGTGAEDATGPEVLEGYLDVDLDLGGQEGR